MPSGRQNTYVKQPNERAKLGKRSLVARTTNAAATGQNAPFAWMAEETKPIDDVCIAQPEVLAATNEANTAAEEVAVVAFTSSEVEPAAPASANDDEITDAPAAGMPTAPHSSANSLTAPFAVDISEEASSEMIRNTKRAIVAPAAAPTADADAPAAGMRSMAVTGMSKKAHIPPPEAAAPRAPAPFAWTASGEEMAEGSSPSKRKRGGNAAATSMVDTGGAADEAPAAGMRSSAAPTASHKAMRPPEAPATASSAPWDTSWQPSPEKRQKHRQQQQQQNAEQAEQAAGRANAARPPAGARIPPPFARDDTFEATLVKKTMGANSMPPAGKALTAPASADEPAQLTASNNISLEELGEAQVANLLSKLGLGKYAEAAKALPLRGSDLLHCTPEDLDAIGIRFRPHRLSFMDEVAKLRRGGVPPEMVADPPLPEETEEPAAAAAASPEETTFSTSYEMEQPSDSLAPATRKQQPPPQPKHQPVACEAEEEDMAEVASSRAAEKAATHKHAAGGAAAERPAVRRPSRPPRAFWCEMDEAGNLVMGGPEDEESDEEEEPDEEDEPDESDEDAEEAEGEKMDNEEIARIRARALSNASAAISAAKRAIADFESRKAAAAKEAAAAAQKPMAQPAPPGKLGGARRVPLPSANIQASGGLTPVGGANADAAVSKRAARLELNKLEIYEDVPAAAASNVEPPRMSKSLSSQKPRSELVKPTAQRKSLAGKGHGFDPNDAENVGGNAGNGNGNGGLKKRAGLGGAGNNHNLGDGRKPMVWTTDGALPQDEEDAAAAAAEMKRGLARAAAAASKANSFSFVC